MVITTTESDPFPPYRYLGPGNRLFNGIPINQADEIAQEHDLAYESLIRDEHLTDEQFHQGVIDIDNRAVHRFFAANPQLDGVISGLLLGVKSLTEYVLRLIGVRHLPLYPHRYGSN